MRNPIPTPYCVNPLKRLAGIIPEGRPFAWRHTSPSGSLAAGTREKQGPSRRTAPALAVGQYAYFGGLEPSVAQPPLPLQEFLPLQPLSPDLQPPLPFQEFCPLQACLSWKKLAAIWPLLAAENELLEGAVCAIAPLPAMNPASAAPIISDFIDLVIVILLLKVVWVVVKWLILTSLVLLTCERSFRISSREENLLPEAIFSGAPLR